MKVRVQLEIIGTRNVVKLKWINYKICYVTLCVVNDSRTCEQDVTERYFFFSEGSNGAGKNEFVP